jgi:hypothetical protein
LFVLLATAPLARGDSFFDLTSFDTGTEMAFGQLNGINFTVISTRPVPRPGSGDNGGVTGGVTDGTSTAFSGPFFTPNLPMGDLLGLGTASDFTITFAQPMTDFTLHLSQLQNNQLSFTSGGVPISFALVNSDDDFTVSGGNTQIQGSPGSGDDANGSLFFAGTFSEISWTSNSVSPEDGMGIQISIVPEPASVALLLTGAATAWLWKARRRRS